MLTQKKIIARLRRELPYLRDRYGVKAIGLFGSFVKGMQREDSDVDILVEFEKPIGLEFVDLAEHIEKLLGKKVDILTLEGVNGIRLKHIARSIERGVVYV